MPATDDPDRTPEPARPGPGNEATPEQVDAEFARIVAGFDTPVVTPTWPATEEQTGSPVPAGPVWPAGGPILNRGGPTGDPRAVGPDDPSLLDSLDTFGGGLPDDTPDEFVPPPPRRCPGSRSRRSCPCWPSSSASCCSSTPGCCPSTSG
ncbi:hypothetical protein ACFQY4_08980 [Catellatospora bangladeshensis]|uniref:hypothetical protein n=1 Tax=Catellatospora bangladeshensis TaxID=310355 RepID=UPI00361C7AAC